MDKEKQREKSGKGPQWSFIFCTENWRHDLFREQNRCLYAAV